MLEIHTGERRACSCKWMELSELVVTESLLCFSFVVLWKTKRNLDYFYCWCIFAVLEENPWWNNTSLIFVFSIFYRLLFCSHNSRISLQWKLKQVKIYHISQRGGEQSLYFFFSFCIECVFIAFFLLPLQRRDPRWRYYCKSQWASFDDFQWPARGCDEWITSTTWSSKRKWWLAI